jgi:antirestriction protein ArdC
MHKSHTPRRDIAAEITAAIVARLEAGARPWVRPWRSAGRQRPLRACGVPYRGINVFWLWLVAEMRGFAAPRWLTYRQCQALGGQVRKGETASIAVFYKTYGKENEEGDTETRRVLRAYAVFNAEQCDNLPDTFAPPQADGPAPQGQRAEIDAFFERLPAQVRHHGDEAYYEPASDRITLPPVERFTGFDQYYATRAHELAHWTGHASRLARDMSGRFRTRAYAAEELVAELASAIVGAELGLPVVHLDDHASYIADWISLLKDDPRAMLTAAARAEEAASLLFELGGRGLSAGDDADDGEALS